MRKTLTCIICPKGCTLKVSGKKENLKVVGNGCERGKNYAVSEINDPHRTLTTTVKIKSKEYHLLPVKTDKAIRKDKVFSAMKKISKLEVEPPVHVGDVIVEDFIDKGINLVATKDIEE